MDSAEINEEERDAKRFRAVERVVHDSLKRTLFIQRPDIQRASRQDQHTTSFTRLTCARTSGLASSSELMQPAVQRCRLLELPAEVRELVWIATVTELVADNQELSPQNRGVLVKRPIRLDKLNRPSPPAITKVSRKVQAETLPLYYACNVFECWRPLYWIYDWSNSTLIDWLSTLKEREVSWLRHIVLLYKSKDELEYDVEAALLEQGYGLNNCKITCKLELSEYERMFSELGLPRHFGKKRRNDRYGVAHTNAT